MSSTIYLVRHAETTLNADGKLRGLADPVLNEKGRQQARSLAAALADSSASVVVASPLRRAQETARAIDRRRRCARRRGGDQVIGPAPIR